MKKVFKYIEPLWLGTNGKISIRKVLALVFSIDFVRNTSHAIYKWEIGKSYADVAMLLGIEAALIAALLSLTTYTAMINKKIDNSQTSE
jgi:hypothetical protein